MQATIAHSPDPDDAFMVFGLRRGAVQTRFDLDLVSEPIDKLNEQAARGVWEVSALSVHAYAHLTEQYRLLSAGTSVGRGYGPVVVASEPLDPQDLEGARVAVPGEWTTAYLVAKLALPAFQGGKVDFDQIPRAVQEGGIDAGIVIHEGQVTVEDRGLHRVVDLGTWWEDETGLPLPLGVNAVTRRLPRSVQVGLGRAFRDSVRYALDHRDAAIDYAMTFGRRLTRDQVDEFVGMYANEDSVEMEDDVEKALETLYARAVDAELLEDPVDLDVLRVGGA